MTVSVLLTAYNQGAYLGRAIQSVLKQTYADWELLILDDGSTDDTGDVIEALEVADDWMRFTPSERERRQSVRYASNLNFGVEQTSGESLTFLCGDDWFMPDRLERMVSRIEEGCDVVYGPQALFDESGHQFGLRETLGVLDDAYHRVDLNSVMVTREAFDAVGGFPDRPATPELWREADAQFWNRLTAAGYRFVPVVGHDPTDCKQYLSTGVDARVIAGLEPW